MFSFNEFFRVSIEKKKFVFLQEGQIHQKQMFWRNIIFLQSSIFVQALQKLEKLMELQNGGMLPIDILYLEVKICKKKIKYQIISHTDIDWGRYSPLADENVVQIN